MSNVLIVFNKEKGARVWVYKCAKVVESDRANFVLMSVYLGSFYCMMITTHNSSIFNLDQSLVLQNNLNGTKNLFEGKEHKASLVPTFCLTTNSCPPVHVNNLKQCKAAQPLQHLRFLSLSSFGEQNELPVLNSLGCTAEQIERESCWLIVINIVDGSCFYVMFVHRISSIPPYIFESRYPLHQMLLLHG
ncbi:hypothetical protein BCR41DRAFT_375157 [Lobosporangium transversale]|uniref:Uncharacterized protein n=1 Tax=Lobosporangium transversale TaxID=64571 RepID=A0A1Y2G854_9FUNG|nr:hypothetical protein BCR41DRAFT_375157 [Lobosporangium transversale]ORZ02072.1 hypothetical protein BCR41DRAFT_375157 [Lobosporangium transversale]|eukprot:XP_021876300.1 hypothetical protein BCR41DRAFT_375157 [Lobosporangium transversale]